MECSSLFAKDERLTERGWTNRRKEGKEVALIASFFLPPKLSDGRALDNPTEYC